MLKLSFRSVQHRGFCVFSRSVSGGGEQNNQIKFHSMHSNTHFSRIAKIVILMSFLSAQTSFFFARQQICAFHLELFAMINFSSSQGLRWDGISWVKWAKRVNDIPLILICKLPFYAYQAAFFTLKGLVLRDWGCPGICWGFWWNIFCEFVEKIKVGFSLAENLMEIIKNLKENLMKIKTQDWSA